MSQQNEGGWLKEGKVKDTDEERLKSGKKPVKPKKSILLFDYLIFLEGFLSRRLAKKKNDEIIKEQEQKSNIKECNTESKTKSLTLGKSEKSVKALIEHKAFNDDDDDTDIVSIIPDITDEQKGFGSLDQALTNNILRPLYSVAELDTKRQDILPEPEIVQKLNSELMREKKLDFSIFLQHIIPKATLDLEEDEIWNIDEILDSIQLQN